MFFTVSILPSVYKGGGGGEIRARELFGFTTLGMQSTFELPSSLELTLDKKKTKQDKGFL